MKNVHINVLAIEDNPDDAELIRRMLVKMREPSFTFVQAPRLSEGLQLLREGSFDIVLVDLGLPDSEGMDSVAQIRMQSPTIPIIVFTGINDDEVALKALHMDVQDYLTKGQIDHNLLVRSIRYAIERKRAIEALRNSEARFRRLSESGIIGIACFDANGRTIDGNDKFLAMIGSNREELAAGRVRRWGRLVPPEWKTRMREASEEFRTTGRITPYETEYLSRDGTRYWGLFGAAKLDGQPNEIAFIVDITERKRLEEKITHMAHHDVLTGLPNRRLFLELIRLKIAEARRNRTKTGLLFLDLDRFKEVNDTLGHEAGDQLLRMVAERLRAAIRDSDAVAGSAGTSSVSFLRASRGRRISRKLPRRSWRPSVRNASLAATSLPSQPAWASASIPMTATLLNRCSGTRTLPCTTPRTGAGTRSSSTIRISTGVQSSGSNLKTIFARPWRAGN